MPFCNGNTYRTLGWLIAVLLLAGGIALAAEPVDEQTAEQKPLFEDRDDSQGQPNASEPNQTYTPESVESRRSLTALYAQIDALISDITAALRNPNAEREQQRGDDDLSAQKDMAFWAMLMFGAVVAQTGITAFGVFLVWGTLNEARDATNAAIAATTAAEDAVTITADTAERQLRAYVSLMETSMKWENARTIRTKLTFKNNGLTPAYNFHVVAGRGVTMENDFVEPDSFPPAAKIDLGPGATMTSTILSERISDALWEDYKSGKILFFCWGEVKYIDAFEGERFTKYCLVLDTEDDAWLAYYEGNTSN